jgi:tRNA (cmo5U34)-methyltransferase
MSDLKNNGIQDDIYKNPQDQIKDFSFNRQVVDVFPDMIERSVPGYSNIVDGIGRLAAKFSIENTNLYDLGCSLGAVSLSMAKQNKVKRVNIIGVDNSAAMVERCQRHVHAYSYFTPITVQDADITNLNITNASVIVMNFTLQFIAPMERASLKRKLYDALVPGGILILSEKIKIAHPAMDSAIIDLHHDFKRENGYSDLEISQKRTALENVMVLDEYSLHEERLLNAGFDAVSVWYQQFNFVSFFAIKGK